MNFDLFMHVLPYMGKGYLAIFIVTAIMIFSMLKTTSAPFLLIIFIGVSSLDINNVKIFCV